jgi:hypothetical protein
MKITWQKASLHYLALPVLLAVLFISIPASVIPVHAQSSKASVSGDEVCGADQYHECKLSDIPNIMKSAIKIVIALGLPLLVVFVTYRFVMAWFALQQGNANAYKEALKKSTNAVLGFFLIVAIFGGLFVVVLKYFGIKDNLLNIPIIKGAFFDVFATHAYAADGQYLPNFFGSNDIYDLITSAIRLIMRFFVYPALLVMWVWTGFSFVAAQGAPDALVKAKKWFMWAVITTLVIFMVQAFLTALHGTVEKILPNTANMLLKEESHA